jgi:membrane associated rhomboid family serine protease
VIPYRDENPTVRTPIVTFVIVGLNVMMWLLVQGAGSTGISPSGEVSGLAASVCNLGLIPGELTLQAQVGAALPIGENLACTIDPGRQATHLVTSMFLHGSWMHIIGNMWFLWIFGNNVEDSMGRLRFALFYVLCGLGAAFAQVASNPDSMVPMVGASGAIGGVMGAYVILYPKVRVFTFVPLGFFMTSVALPAWVMLGYWMLLQFLGTLGGTEGGGVAFWAHIGGFAAGAVLIKLFVRPDYVAEHKRQHWRPRHLGFEQNRWS